MPDMILVLEDGTRLAGQGFGARAPVVGEVVFNTGMTGYVEALTDPSYRGQILVLTYPLAGNYGVPPARVPGSLDRPFESDRIQVQGLVVQNYVADYSHHGAARSLGDWLAAEQVPAISGIDTRTLTRKLREHGTMRGWVFPAETRPAQARASAAAQKALSAIYRTEQRFGAMHVIDVLRGKGGDKVGRWEHDRLSVFGIVSGDEAALLKPVARALQVHDALTTNEHGGLAFSPALRDHLKGATPAETGTPPGQGRRPPPTAVGGWRAGAHCRGSLCAPAAPDGLQIALDRARTVDWQDRRQTILDWARQFDWRTIGRRFADLYEQVLAGGQ